MLWLAHAAHAGASRSAAGGGEIACSGGAGGSGRFCSPPRPQEAEDALGRVEAVPRADIGGRRDTAERESPERHGGVPREQREEEEHRQGSLPQLQ